MKERPLILFTLLSQLAVGIFVLASITDALMAYELASKTAPEKAAALTHLALLATAPLALLGMLASFLHLGTPRNAWRALANLRTSWLSREILFAGLFAGLSGLFSFLQWLGWGPGWLRHGLAVLAAACGLMLVYSMARVYMLRTVPAWQTWMTTASFFTTAFFLGSLVLAAINAGPLSPAKEHLAWLIWRLEFLPRLTLAGVLHLGVQALFTAHWAVQHTQPARHLALATACQRPRPSTERALTWLRLRLGLSTAGLILYILAYPEYHVPLAAITLWLAFALALAGEVIGKYLFYSILE